MGIGTVLHVPNVQKVRRKMTYIMQKHNIKIEIKKNTNTKPLEIKTIMSKVKISLDEIISRWHTAEENMVPWVISNGNYPKWNRIFFLKREENIDASEITLSILHMLPQLILTKY